MSGGMDGAVYNRNRDGNSCVRYLYWNDGQWNWNAHWLDNDWNGNNPVLVRATNKISNTSYFGSVCFSTCPIQP